GVSRYCKLDSSLANTRANDLSTTENNAAMARREGLRSQRTAKTKFSSPLLPPLALEFSTVHVPQRILSTFAPQPVEAYSVAKHRRMSWLASALALVALSQAGPGIAGEAAPLAPGFTVRA